MFSVIFYVASAFVLYFFARYMEEYLKLPRQGPNVLSELRAPGVRRADPLRPLQAPSPGAIFTVTEHGSSGGALFLISQLVPLYCYLLFTATVILCQEKPGPAASGVLPALHLRPLGAVAAQMFLRGAVVNIGVSCVLFILVNIQFEYEIKVKSRRAGWPG